MAGQNEWKTKLKKDSVLVTIQNTTPYNLELSGAALREGSYVKKSQPLSLIAPNALAEMGIKKPEGEFVWVVREDDPAQNQLRLQISFKGQQAKTEPVPPTAIWTVDVQQQWQRQPCPQVLITIMSRELVNTENSPVPKPRKHKTKKEDDGSGSGTLDDKKRRGSTTLKKKRKDSGTLTSADVKKEPAPIAQEPVTGFSHDSSSDSEDDRPKNRRISVIIKDKSQIENQGDDLKSMASFLGVALGKTPNSSLKRPASGAFFAPPTTGQALTSFGDEDFFATSNQPPKPSSGMSEDEQLQLALAMSASEADSKKSNGNASSKSPRRTEVSAEALGAFTNALDALDSKGDLITAQRELKNAIQLLGAEPAGPEVKEWASYRIVVDLLLEMQRLEQQKLWQQRALVSRFAAAFAAANFTNAEHRLIVLRAGINRNFEIGNFLTASQLLRTIEAEQLSLQEADLVQRKLGICGMLNFSENHVPKNCTAETSTGLTFNGVPLTLCLKTFKLIRSKPHLVCHTCDAHYDANAGVSKCIYSGNALSKA